MARNDRLFDLIQILRDGALHRSEDLARQLGVSTRTIWRDMATLVDSGLPIEGARGVGYVMRAQVSLPPLALSRDEFEALRLGLALADGARDPSLARAASGVRAKINALVPTSLQDPTDATLAYAGAGARAAAAHLPDLRRALREKRQVALSYISAWGTRRDHRIRPLRLTFWGQVWTLLAWCETSDDFRLLRVDLIQSLTLLPDGFFAEDGKRVEDYLARLDAF